jgi:hypothetical protein
MSPIPERAWAPIRIEGCGIQPAIAQAWDCVPAWDITAIQESADGVIAKPDAPEQRCFVFWDRHVDRRFRIAYPHATRATPRATGRTIGDPDREWDVLIEHRDRYLRDAGLTPESPPEAIARCFADSFAAEPFARKPVCPTFPEKPRSLCHGIEGLLHKSFCVGCAKAFGLLADSCGIPTRFIGCGSHYVAEALIGDAWHMVDSIGRHPENAGYPMYFAYSYMDLVLNPAGDFGMELPDKVREGFFKRPSGQFHFHNGQWDGPQSMRFAMGNAFALYPETARWGFKSPDGHRLPLLANRGGFYWPVIHENDGRQLARLRANAYPDPLGEVPPRDYLFHRFQRGQRIRQSFWLGSLEGVTEVEVAIAFAPSRQSDWGLQAGRNLHLHVQGMGRRSLADWGAWPPSETPGNLPAAIVRLPVDVLRANRVHWVELEHGENGEYFMPFVPNVMTPYIPPLLG